MRGSGIKISVVVPAYQAAGTIGRLIESLDSQTLPQEEFEVVVVDDGSSDGTSDAVRRLQGSRPNLVSHRIEASGWASRPRNVGLGLARGEYVLFMDSDDTLYPDALRRCHEFATEHDSDIVSPKESQTKQPWYGMSSFRENVPNLIGGAGISGLLPMTPHKLFRRDFLLEHGLRFQESEAGERVLWEDVRLVMEAYRHARVVSVLADTAVYHWHSSAGSISKSYGARTAEFWDQVERLLQFIHALFAGEEFVQEREAMLVQQYKVRLLGRFCTLAATSGVTDEELALPFTRLRALQEAYLPLALDEQLGVLDRSRAALVRAARLDLLQRLIAVDKGIANSSAVTHVEWRGAVALVTARTTWTRKGGPVLEAHGDRVVRAMPDELAVVLPSELVDVTDSASTMATSVWVRDPDRIITWAVPATSTKRLIEAKAGGWTIEVVTHAVLDLRTLVFGRPLDGAVWEFWIETAWIGALRRSRMRFKGKPLGVLQGGSVAELRANQEHKLVLDRSTPIGRAFRLGRPPVNVSLGTGARFHMPLPALEAAEPSEATAELVLVPLDHGGGRPVIRGRVVGTPSGAAFIGSGDLPRGRYRLVEPDGVVLPSSPTFRVGIGGRIRIQRSAAPWNRARVAAAIQRRLAAGRA